MRAPLSPPLIRQIVLSDGYVVAARLWMPPQGPPRDLVLYLHGIQSHGGWYEWSASLLASQGAAVLVPDRRGSGLNREARGDTPSAEQLLADLSFLATALAREVGTVAQPVSVVGVSWGGKLALAWALRMAWFARRLLLIAPGVFPAVGVSLLERLRIAWSLLTAPDRLHPIPLDDATLFTDQPDGQTFIRHDPLKLTRVTARFLWESERLGGWLRRAPRGSLECPVTLLLAGRDRVVRNQPTIAWLRHVARALPEVRKFRDAAHTLEFEPGVTELSATLREWCAGVPAVRSTEILA